MDADFLAAVDRVGIVRLDPSTFPHDPPPEFRVAAVDMLGELARQRYALDGGDPADLDGLDVDDQRLVVDLDDLRGVVEGFHEAGDQARYSACAAVFDWATAAGY